METLLFQYFFITIYKITRRLISEAGKINVHRHLSTRSQILKWIFVTLNLIRLSQGIKRSSFMRSINCSNCNAVRVFWFVCLFVCLFVKTGMCVCE